MSGTIQSGACDQFEDSYDLYVLGSLESADADALTSHIRAGCAHCEGQLQLAVHRIHAISQTVPLLEPPARLRRRLASSLGAVPASRLSLYPWLIALTASLIFGMFSLREYQAHHSEQQLSRTLTAESARVSDVLQILAAPGTVEIPLSDIQRQSLHGAVYVHEKLGMAMVVDSLPMAPSGWIYKSWVSPRNGAPQAIESFATDPRGHAVTIFRGPVDIGRFSALMISMERLGTTEAKPTTVVFSAVLKNNG